MSASLPYEQAIMRLHALEQILVPFARAARAFDGRDDRSKVLSTALGEISVADLRAAQTALNLK